MSNRYADILARHWFRHEVILAGEDVRTGIGIVKGEPTPIMADVSAEARVVTNPQGEEVTVAATVTWHPDGPRPRVGQTLTLPEEFGMKPDREIITVKVDTSCTGFTPDHIEVTIK